MVSHKFAAMKGKNFSKACIVILISIFGHLAAPAQLPYFMYIQSENNQPFFVQVGQKKYNSSSIGHCIVPGLLNGQYKVAVSLDESTSPQDYTVNIKDSDQGFLIKAMNGGTEYALLNLKTAIVQYSGAEKQKALDAEKAKKEADIAKVRAEESAKLEKETLQAAEKKVVEEKETILQKQNDEERKIREQKAIADLQGDSLTKNEAAEKFIEKVMPAPKELKVLTEEEVAQKAFKEKQESEIKKYNDERRLAMEKENAENAGVVSKDNSVIPVTPQDGGLSRAEIARLQEEARKIDAQGKRDSVLKAKEDRQAPTKKEKTAFLDMDFTMPEPKKDTVIIDTSSTTKEDLPKQKEPAVPENKVDEQKADLKIDSLIILKEDTLAVLPLNPIIIEEEKKEIPASEKPIEPKKKTACNATASSEEVELIAMMIKAEKNGDEAIDLIRKITRLKCINTQQVRLLAGAFAGEEERYRVLDLCYKYTLDQEAYPALANLLTDIYYINRFKSLLR